MEQTKRPLNVIEDELDVMPWVELGLREINEFLALHAAFDRWLAANGRT